MSYSLEFMPELLSLSYWDSVENQKGPEIAINIETYTLLCEMWHFKFRVKCELLIKCNSMAVRLEPRQWSTSEGIIEV